ncbi:hypothetical protein RintRC_1054 [Richelia intracellularis]|nr:hypothetical protein RintRC_1054 [Richelia intracellularis]
MVRVKPNLYQSPLQVWLFLLVVKLIKQLPNLSGQHFICFLDKIPSTTVLT